MKNLIAAAALAGAFFAAGAATAADTETMMAAQGQNIFQHRCGGCHSADPSKNTFGPSLSGVIGRPAASLARFAYSDALKTSKIVWTEDNLRKWIANNDQFVPGTRMRHVAITDGAEQDYLLAFLRALK